MPTIFHNYQVRFVITGLTNLADELELAEVPAWHTIASSAACLERLLHDEQPSDIAAVVADLRALNIPSPSARRCGRFTYHLVDLTIVILEGVRLGLIDIQPKMQRPQLRPIWIGIDMGSGDRTVYGDHHA